MKRLTRLLIPAILASMIGLTGSTVAAQDSSETTSLLVSALYCESDTGFAGGDCEAAGGVSVTVDELGGSTLGSCVTEVGTVQDTESGYCYVRVPYGVDVVATLDTSTLAAGYTPSENPVQVSVRSQEESSAPDYIPVALFLNVPVESEPDPDEGEQAPESPAPQLPRTGSGPASGATQWDMLLMASGAMAASGLMFRQRTVSRR